MVKRLHLFLFISIFFQTFVRAQMLPADMLENVLSAVVTVAVYETGEGKKSLGFRGTPTDIAYSKMLDLSNAKGSGSGFVVSRNGKKYVITNAHVVEQASNRNGSIFIYSITRKKYETRIIGGDSFYDLAVLEFITPAGSEITTVAFREPEIRVGEQVYAVGNPLGEYPYSVSEGIISAKNRVRGGLTGKFGFLQSTATVIWGNSGGPLVDNQGRVVGINSQIAFAENAGTQVWQPQINFALEAGISQRLITDILENNGFVNRAYVGIQVAKSAPNLNPQHYNYRRAQEQAAQEAYPVITGLIPGSPAAKALAGKEGAGIAAVNKNDTRNAEEVLGEFEKVKPGENIQLTIIQNGQKQEVTIKTAALNKSRSLEMIEYLAAANNWKLKQGNNRQVEINFKPAANKQAPNEKNFPIGTTGNEKAGTTTPTEGDWQVIAMGVAERDYQNIWRVEDLADMATAARLTGLTGILDLVILKKGSDPENAANYLVKRLSFSDNPNLSKQTLLY